jgi:hypothetical protein
MDATRRQGLSCQPSNFLAVAEVGPRVFVVGTKDEGGEECRHPGMMAAAGPG